MDGITNQNRMPVENAWNPDAWILVVDGDADPQEAERLMANPAFRKVRKVCEPGVEVRQEDGGGKIPARAPKVGESKGIGSQSADLSESGSATGSGGGRAALVLRLNGEGLSLEGDGMSLRGDFRDMLSRIRPDRLNRELLIRAVKIKKVSRPLAVIDATAGMGEDSLLLAAAGCSVTMYERDPVISALLRNALRRAEEIPELRDVVGRMRLQETDSQEAMRHLEEPPDVVFLDPMFPARQKSALVKKKFQLLHRLEQPCVGEHELLEAAMAASPAKIVIKRPKKGGYLAGRKPDYSLEGKAIRYDCIWLR